LFVNDRLCRRQTLCIDDVIQIGAFEFVLRRGPGRTQARDTPGEDRRPLTVDQILRTIEQANPDALVLNRQSAAELVKLSDVERVPQAHLLRRAFHHNDAALRLLIAQDTNETTPSLSPRHSAPRPHNRVA
jgi:hypothetical protein